MLGEALQRLIKVVGIALVALPFLAAAAGAHHRRGLALLGDGRARAARCSCRWPSTRCAGRPMRRRSWSGRMLPAVAWLLSRLHAPPSGRRRAAAAAADPGRAVLAAAARRGRCPSRRSRAPAAPARSTGWPRCSIARRRRRRSSPTPTTAPSFCIGRRISVLSIPNHRPQPGFARDLAHPDRDRRRRRAGRADPFWRRLDPAVPERDRAGAVRRARRRAGRRSTSAWPMARRPPGCARCRSRAISPPRRACSRSIRPSDRTAATTHRVAR